MLAWFSVKSFDVSHRWLIPTKHVYESVLNCDCSRQVPIPVKFRLFTPRVTGDWVNLTSFRCIVQAWSDSVDEVRSYGSEAVALSRVEHIWQLDQRSIP
jgi:hypothetical protein